MHKSDYRYLILSTQRTVKSAILPDSVLPRHFSSTLETSVASLLQQTASWVAVCGKHPLLFRFFRSDLSLHYWFRTSFLCLYFFIFFLLYGVCKLVSFLFFSFSLL